MFVSNFAILLVIIYAGRHQETIYEKITIPTINEIMTLYKKCLLISSSFLT